MVQASSIISSVAIALAVILICSLDESTMYTSSKPRSIKFFRVALPNTGTDSSRTCQILCSLGRISYEYFLSACSPINSARKFNETFATPFERLVKYNDKVGSCSFFNSERPTRYHNVAPASWVCPLVHLKSIALALVEPSFLPAAIMPIAISKEAAISKIFRITLNCLVIIIILLFPALRCPFHIGTL